MVRGHPGPSTVIVVLMVHALGCGGNEDETEPIVAPPPCALGEWLRDDGVCIAAGLPSDMPCPPGEWSSDVGSCIPAGVPPDGCGAGFVHDGDRGCEPILPEANCPAGFMAVPGETSCREIAPCASGKWGDIPIEPDTEYVDGSYTGMDSDGSALKPWITIQAAIDAAAPGAIVAVAQGSYTEDLFVASSSVRLWGVCPSLVEVVGSGTESAITIYPGASETEVRGLAVTGAAMGVLLVGSIDVLVDRVWVHGTANRGIGLQSDLGPTSMTVRSSLFEQCTEVGLFLKGADAIVEASVIRATQPNAQGLAGRGINARAGAATASVVMRGTLIDQNREAGVHFAGVNATVEESVIRDTSPSPQRFGGFGMDAQTEPTTGATSTLVLRASWIGQNENVGLLVEGSQVTVERSVIRDTLSGHGIDAHDHHATGALSTLLLDRSLLADNQEIALLLEGSAATVDRSAIRATQPGGVKGMGRGIGAQASAVTATAATLSVFGSLVEQSYDIGIFASGANATVEATWVRDTQPNGLGVHGHGLSAQQDTNFRIPSTLVVRTSLVERSHGIAILVSGSTGTIESSLVVDTQPDGNDNFGDGIVVAFESAPASVTLTGLRIDRSARAALGAFGAYVGLSGSALSCQAFDLDSEDYLGSAPELDDLGGNRCGCPDASLPCKAVSAGLQPPEAIEQTVH